MLRKFKQKLKLRNKKETLVQCDREPAVPSTLSHTSVPANQDIDISAPYYQANSSSRLSSAEPVSYSSSPDAVHHDLPSATPISSGVLPLNSNSSKHQAHENSGDHKQQLTCPTIDVLPGNSAEPDKSTLAPNQTSWMDNVVRVSKSILKTLAVFTGAPAIDSFLESLEANEATQVGLTMLDLEEYCGNLMKSVKELAEKEGLNASQKLKNSLGEFYSTLSRLSQEIHISENNLASMERLCRNITQAFHSFMLVNCISGVIGAEGTLTNVEKHVLSNCIQNLPRVDAAYNDYESKKRSGPCFDGTREALLQAIAEWISVVKNIQLYLLYGIAGIGKSTVAYTVAERAEHFGYLGASFFFSRNGAERGNAKRFFTTIAFQLCLYDKEFAHAIEKALLTERGMGAVTKDPITQLEALILEPLRDIVKSRSSPIVTVVDALDECDEQDAPVVLAALSRLARELPCFKIIVTTRPEPHLPPVPDVHEVFHLQDVEEKIVEGDIRLYLTHTLSQSKVAKHIPGLRKPWGVSSENLDTLVKIAGRLFIIASTVCLFILDKTVRNPASQMQWLQEKLAQDQTPFETLNDFYTVILRRAVPMNSRLSLIQRFHNVLGSVIFIQDPLPIETVGKLIHTDVDDISAVLDNLRSVILLRGNDAPLIYHKSFPDFVTDATQCKDDDLRIIPRDHHTQLATRCFETMNKHLKQNILGLGAPARFMPNNHGLAAEHITVEYLTEKIPGELRYACIYWAYHIHNADMTDIDLIKLVEIFVSKHLLHWLEVLSWVGRLDISYHALCVVQKLMKATTLHEIVSDALRFVPKFYDLIHHSALHTYYSAIPFTPTESLLYRNSRKEMDGLCLPEGMPTQWDALVTYFGRGNGPRHLVFSQDNSKFASSSANRREMCLWDTKDGSLLRIFTGESTVIAGDFSTVALSRDRVVALWNVASNTPMATFTHSDKVAALALACDGSRIAVGSSDGKVSLWNGGKIELMARIDGYTHKHGQLEFSPRGYRFAFVSDDCAIQLWDGYKGELVSRLAYRSTKPYQFVFSRDGCRLASLVKEDGRYSLTLWDVEKEGLISVAEDVEDKIAISEDGSLIAIGGREIVKLWSENPLTVVDTLDVGGRVDCLAISSDILAIGSSVGKALVLYDIHNRALIGALQPIWPVSLALSPDCTRLATGNFGGRLFDMPSVKASILPSDSEGRPTVCITTVAFSPDCSWLASGFDDGIVGLWDAGCIARPISTHRLHSGTITALAFTPDGERFASGSQDRTVRFWGGRDCTPSGNLEHSFYDALTSMAFSNDLLATATSDNITLFDRKSLRLVDTLQDGSHSLLFSADGSLLASALNDAFMSDITVWNVHGRTVIAVFKSDLVVRKLVFSTDGSQLAAQSGPMVGGIFGLFDVVNKYTTEPAGHKLLSWVPHCINGVLISWTYDYANKHQLVGQFSGRHDWIPVLCFPPEIGIRGFDIGNSIIAFGCHDGRILLIRFPTAGIN